MRSITIVSVVVVLAGHTLQGQSLADVAKKEEARRRTVRISGRVYTNQDLPETPQPVAMPAAVVQTSPDATVTKPGTVEPATDGTQNTEGTQKEAALRRDTEKNRWRNLARDYAARLGALRGDIDAVQTRLRTLRDGQQTPAIASEIVRAEKDLRALEYNLGLVQKDWERIEEEARKSGASALLQE